MDDADQILINSLISIGLEINISNISFEHFSPDILIQATSICLELIFESRNEQQSFPKSCPANMASRYKVGQSLSEALKYIGYKDDIGYQAFLYPNIKDTRKIISFLVENLPKETGPSVVDETSATNRIQTIIKNTFTESSKIPWLPFYCHNREKSSKSYFSTKSFLIPFKSDVTKLKNLSKWFESFPCLTSYFDEFSELVPLIWNYEKKLRICDTVDEKMISNLIKSINNQYDDKSVKREVKPISMKRKKFLHKIEKVTEKNVQEANKSEEEENKELQSNLDQMEQLYEESLRRYEELLSRFDRLNEEYESLMESEFEMDRNMEKAMKDLEVKEKIGNLLSHGDTSVDKLQSAINKRQNQLENIQSQWDTHRKDLENKITEVKLKSSEKFTKTNELEKHLQQTQLEMEECRRDYQEKDMEIRLLEDKVAQIMKGPSNKQNRNDFTKRILELTENKKKQKKEIRKILADIYVLQKEINNLRGKLERSFIETSDCIFEYSRKDEMSKKMHKVLLGIHENCSNLVGVIEEKGRLLREIRDLETSIENENRENVEKNLEKITADLEEAKENCANLKNIIRNHNIIDPNN